MYCLEHICSEGCTSVGPHDMDLSKEKGPCSKFTTCHGLQLLIKHFGNCKKRINGGCLRCKRMWQLFRLHSSICDLSDECRVPLCRHFKSKKLLDGSKTDEISRICYINTTYELFIGGLISLRNCRNKHISQ